MACFSCGDDDDNRELSEAGSNDAGHDAALEDAGAPPQDARVTDGSDEDASDEVSDAGDGGRDGGPCLEQSYIWAQTEVCFGGGGIQHIARRVTLAEFREDYPCPADWSAALVSAEGCDDDAGTRCWVTPDDCGLDVFGTTTGVNGERCYYDRTTGELMAAAIQLSDAADECSVSEIIAGERPPVCCEP